MSNRRQTGKQERREKKMQNREALARKTGELIYSARKEAKISQEELGARIGSDMRIISNYELGKTIPSAIQIFRIAQALDVSVDSFVPTELQSSKNQNAEAERQKKVNELRTNLEQLLISLL